MGRAIVFVLALVLAVPAGATGKHPKPPEASPPVVVQEGDDNRGALLVLAIVAGVGWWRAKRNKRHQPPPPVCEVKTCEVATCPGPSERENRIFEACVGKGAEPLVVQ